VGNNAVQIVSVFVVRAGWWVYTETVTCTRVTCVPVWSLQSYAK